MNQNKIVVLLFFFLSSIVYSQVETQIQKYRNEPYGDKIYRKKGTMNGNLIRTIFRNDGQVGTWPDRPSGEWPKGTGHNYLDGVCPLFASEIIAPGNGQVVHPVITSYREEVDFDPVTNELWVLEPVPGYVNPSSEDPAISTMPNSWPQTWPRALPNIDANWDGYWYGYFGRGVHNADFETFFVMDDSKDKEFTRNPYNYFPIASDHERGGLGLRVEVRGFQWSHVLAEDIIFWHFDIVNLSDNDLDSTYFGYYADTGVGGVDDNGDDNASYDIKLDLAYAFDSDGQAPPDMWKTGYVGYAYLESPGNALNALDDDLDGMIDESRDDGIDNDGDWIPYSDLNGNGQWDAEENEPLNNDVGVDGVGPFDRHYNGPDEGEGDGVPTDGEPNFDKTDKDESDQIGLTSLSIYRLSGKGPTDGWPKNDEVMWNKMGYNNFDTTLQKSNISIVFGSGPFPLKKNKRERFSMALVFGSNFEDLVFNKETVQQIYNANYNFSKPPLKPTLTAVAGDEKVFLYWDDLAEYSRDPFLGYQNNDPTQGYKMDFEGYLIYRSTEPEFNDPKIITDSKGEPKYWKPITQFDIRDGIKGPDPIGINGAHFWRGNDTGLQHSFIDTNIVNGQTYYYALVSYDQGDPNFGTKGLIPSECTKIISEDLVGNLKFIDINCAVVTPNASAAGYLPPELEGDLSKAATGIGTGYVNVNILDPSQIIEGANYNIIFKSEGEFPLYETESFLIERTVSGSLDTLISSVKKEDFGVSKFSPPFDGLTVSVINDTSVTVDILESGWLPGNSNLFMNIRPDSTSPARNIAWPSDYILEFNSDGSETTPFTKMPISFRVLNTTTDEYVSAEVFDNDNSKDLSVGDDIIILEYIGTKYHLTWKIGYYAPMNGADPILPQAGDRFSFKTTKQFESGDFFTFNTKAENVDMERAMTELDEVAVVPNPYVSGASWEKRNLNQVGRGERKIDFINLPSRCTIRIYTVAGALIKTLEKDSAPSNGSLSWNLVSEDGMDIAFGIYIYHIDAPGVGEKIGKFAIIK